MTYRIAIALATLCFATAALSAQVYRWEDDSGQIHYGQQPPEGVEAEPVDPQVAPGNSGDGNQSGRSAKQTSSSDNKESDGSGTVDKDFVQKQCKKAKKAVSNLKEGGADARYTNADGEIVKYSKSEYKSKLQKNQKFMKKYCDGNQGNDTSS